MDSAAASIQRCAGAAAAGGDLLSYVEDAYLLVGPEALRDRIASALEPFVRTVAAASPEVTIVALPEPPDAGLCARVAAEGERIAIDASLYPSATDGWRLDLGEYRLVLVERTGSLFILAPGQRLAGVFNDGPGGLDEDALRLVKSLITMHCEARGMLVLHASGVAVDGRCLLFAGDSRNGKTTTLLEALDQFEVEMLSCDTSVVFAREGALQVRGWPSNFSVSVGTMFDFASLLDHLEPGMRELSYREAWEIHPKHVLETAAVAAGASWRIAPQGRLDGIVALTFSPEGGVGLTELSGDELHRFLAQVTLGARDPLYPDWHGYWELGPAASSTPVVDLAEWVEAGRIEAYSMRWAPAPATLLRRIPGLDRVHRHTLASRGAVSSP